MTRSNKKQPTDKKPPMGTNELWREIPIGLQGKVRGGVCPGGIGEFGGSGNDA